MANNQVTVLVERYPPQHVEPWRMREQAQILFPSAGVLAVTTESSGYVLQPQSALWLPPGARFQSCSRTAVILSVFNVGEEMSGGMPDEARTFGVSPLLKELFLEAALIQGAYEPAGRDARLLDLMFDEVRRAMPASPVHLPMPRNPRLLKACQAVLRSPAQKDDLDTWARVARMGRRTFTRVFRAETQMSFAEWRRRARLLESLSRLAEGHAVTNVALDVGYSSASAFNAMFRRAVGVSPGRYATRGASAVTAARPAEVWRPAAARPTAVAESGAR